MNLCILLQTTTNDIAVLSASSQSTVDRTANSHHNTSTKHKKERLPSSVLLTKPKIIGQQSAKAENVLGTPILRATYKLESSQALEELLKKREDDLRKRRQHVERLILWHQRLDEEEAEVLNLERQLLTYNNAPHLVAHQQPKLQTNTSYATGKLTPEESSSILLKNDQKSSLKTPEKKRTSRARKMEKRLNEIDKSLRELSHISASSTTAGVMGQTNNENDNTVSSAGTQDVDFVRITGAKLNKLWKRLTSQQIEKFEPNRRYKLCKSDLERLYEEAKMAVLKDFAEDEERIAQELLEKSASNLNSSTSPIAQEPLLLMASENKAIAVPVLNLNFSSGHSEPEEESANNSNTNATQEGIYSPSVEEQNFKDQVLLNSITLSDTLEQHVAAERRHTNRFENNVQMFLALSQRVQTPGHQLKSLAGRKVNGLQRSLSDTEISETPKLMVDRTTTSQRNIVTTTSQSNSSIATNISTEHQRSKSSIVEIVNIPSVHKQIQKHTDCTDFSQNQIDSQDNKNQQIKTPKELQHASELPKHVLKRSSVIRSVGYVTPVKSPTSSDAVTITDDLKSSTAATTCITKYSTGSLSSSPSPPTTLSAISPTKVKYSYSGQVGTDSESKAMEISSKLEQISAAVTQLSQMNNLPSYDSVTQSKAKSIEESLVNSNDESNLSTDASSYTLNFENITTDKHSSPGTSNASFNSNTLQSKSITSLTYTKDKEQVEKEKEVKESSNTLSSDHSATSTSPNETKSKTFVKDDTKLSSQALLTQSMLENRILDTYETDFESDLSNDTRIEDITIPTFETTADTTQEEDKNEEDGNTTSTHSTSSREDDESHKENSSTEILDKTFTAGTPKESCNIEKPLATTSVKCQKPNPDRELLPPPPTLPPPPLTSSPPKSSATAAAVASSTTQAAHDQNSNNHLMPDIINELELRRHQLILDNEYLKQYEHVSAVPYMYVREIPNKPPPPYVPPAHGSPMTTIFPSEERIKDITFRRTHELYCQLLKTEYCNEKGEKIPSVMEEQITNIYERIILDICREYLEEHSEILRDGDPRNFHSQLAFFNPPDRLRCIQDAIYKEVRSCLAMDKTQPKRTQIYSVYGQRAKQDHIGKIIIQEMYDEDDSWCNFHHEESEVLHLMVEEMINKNIVELAKEVLLAEGGTIKEENNEVDKQENEANHHIESLAIEENIDNGNENVETQLQSSILVETLNEEDQTYCIHESKQEYSTVLDSISTEPACTNAVQTCT